MGSDVDYNISERRWKLIMDGPLNVKDESDFGNGDLVSRQYFLFPVAQLQKPTVLLITMHLSFQVFSRFLGYKTSENLQT